MKHRLAMLANVTLFALAGGLMPTAGFAFQADKPADTPAAAATEDVLHMNDGRVLRGQIVSETRTQIVFEYRDPKLNFSTKLTLNVDSIAMIERDVAVETAPPADQAPDAPAAAPAPSGSSSSSSSRKSTASKVSYGASRVETDSPDVPLIYLVPMKGQMVTDVNEVAYKPLIEDIKAKKPAVVVIEMSCTDAEDTFRPAIGEGGFKPEEIGLLDFEELYKLADVFRDELRDIRQVVWIHDAVGISSNIALTWDELYMTPSSRLAGMVMVLLQSGAKGWDDSDVRAKMYAAWTGKAKGLIEYGGYSNVLADAMIDPEYYLSASWHGREVNWTLNPDGEYLVDSRDDRPANFNAKVAEDLCISDGTAENLDDLALLLGIREYRLEDATAVKAVDGYVEDWRRALSDAKKNLEDFKQNMGWANGEQALQYLGKAKGNLEKVLALIERFKAVEIRLARDEGIGKIDLQTQIEQIKEQIRALRDQQRRDGGGGGGGRGMGTGGGGKL